MKTQLPIKTKQEHQGQEEHRVLQFRPRTLPRPPLRRDGFMVPQGTPQGDGQREANDLSRYEQDRQPLDDFHHRMLANAAAFALTVALIAIGIWLAMSLAQMRNIQDCVLMGRSNCARISSQAPPPI
jgi:hypothetical protein